MLELENFVFENHRGQRFEGLANRVYLNANDLRDYAWSFDVLNNRISRFYRAMRNRRIPLVVLCDTEAEATEVKNRLHELAEADIEAKKPGKVIIGEYYTCGYITASVKSKYSKTKRFCIIELTLTSDDPAWYREKNYTFMPGAEDSAGVGGGTEYPYDYPYDYAVSLKGNKINCDSVGGNGFRLTIYGEATDPSVIIGGHTYEIKGTVGRGETLTVDGMNKTITLTNATGKQYNWFDKRGREEYIFEPIPGGESLVSWVGSFGFDLTVIEKRSEPKWT